MSRFPRAHEVATDFGSRGSQNGQATEFSESEIYEQHFGGGPEGGTSCAPFDRAQVAEW